MSIATPLALNASYAIERELGRGGMAVVYLARDRKHDRPVAIKVLRPEIIAGLGPERFLLEIQILARLQHPNILPLLDSGATEEAMPRPFYVMPYIDGETLREQMSHGPFAVTDALRVIREVGEALTYAHGEGLIHRDVKPENVLLTRGHALVADFGIARAVRAVAGDRLTETGLSLGTPAYMSPEQASGTRDTDARSDQYSLACVLYELLGGQPPFTGPNAGVILSRHILDVVPSLAALRPGISRGLQHAIERALAKAPVDRYPSVAGFLAALGAPDLSTAATEKSIVVLPFANLSPDADAAYFADGLMEEVIADLSKVRALRVMSRNSAMQLRGTTKDTRTIGRELAVRYVLEGSVRKAGNTVRITAQLIDAETDAPVWADKYSGKIEDIFELQERLSREIVSAMRVTLSPEESRRVGSGSLNDPVAYDCFIRARQMLHSGDIRQIIATESLLNEARRLAGDHPKVLATMAYQVSMLVQNNVETDEGHYDRALALADKARSLDPECIEAYFALGALYKCRGQVEKASGALRQALAVGPDHSDSLWALSWLLSEVGRTKEARELADRLGRVSPLEPMLWLARVWAEIVDGRFTDAMDHVRRWEQSHAASVYPDLFRGWVLYLTGDRDAVRGWCDDNISQRSDSALSGLSIALLRPWAEGKRVSLTGLPDDTVRYMRNDTEFSWFVASWFAATGEREQAVEWLRRSIRLGMMNHQFLTQHDPYLASLKGFEPYDALMDDLAVRCRDLRV